MSDFSVSVAIVTWNRREEVLRSIMSVLDQTYLPIEIVIVDNNSNFDLSVELESIRKLFNEKSITIKLIKMHRNLGCPQARNIAFANCKGGYIYSLDDDGWLEANAIKACLDVFIKHEDDGVIVVASSVHCPETGVVLTNKSIGVEQKNIFSAGAALYKKSHLNSVGYFPDYFRQMEESHFSMLAYSIGARIYIVQSSIMYHKKYMKGRVQYIETKNNYLNEIKNIAELVTPVGAVFLFFYKSYAHLLSYYRSKSLLMYPKDFITSLFFFLATKRKAVLSLKKYADFRKGKIV